MANRKIEARDAVISGIAAIARGQAPVEQPLMGPQQRQAEIIEACSHIGAYAGEVGKQNFVARILRMPGVTLEDLATVIADRAVEEESRVRRASWSGEEPYDHD
jgi:hypothetical protein